MKTGNGLLLLPLMLFFGNLFIKQGKAPVQGALPFVFMVD